MLVSTATILNDLAVRDVLKQAWLDSQPGIGGGHEEGGFILRMKRVRWLRRAGPKANKTRFGCRRIKAARLMAAKSWRRSTRIRIPAPIICRSRAKPICAPCVMILI